MSKLSLIVAVSENNVIGGDNQLLWRIPEDLKFFKATTLGKPVIMGRKTFDSIGRALPGRPNIVITRQTDWPAPDGVSVAGSLEDAIKMAETMGGDEIMVIGGGTVYAQALPFATSVYLTRIQKVYTGDVTFPALDASVWREVSRTSGTETAQVGFDYEFLKYERVV